MHIAFVVHLCDGLCALHAIFVRFPHHLMSLVCKHPSSAPFVLLNFSTDYVALLGARARALQRGAKQLANPPFTPPPPPPSPRLPPPPRGRVSAATSKQQAQPQWQKRATTAEEEVLQLRGKLADAKQSAKALEKERDHSGQRSSTSRHGGGRVKRSINNCSSERRSRKWSTRGGGWGFGDKVPLWGCTRVAGPVRECKGAFVFSCRRGGIVGHQGDGGRTLDEVVPDY